MKKQIIAGILAFGMIFGPAACGKKQDNKLDEEINNAIFGISSEKSFDGFSGNTSAMTVIGDSVVYYDVIISASEVDMSDASAGDAEGSGNGEMDESQEVDIIYAMPTSGGTGKEIYRTDPAKGYISELLDINGNIGLWYTNYTEEGNRVGDLEVIDTEGNLVETVDLTYVYTSVEDASVFALRFDKDGNMYCLFDDGIRVFGKDHNKICEIKQPEGENYFGLFSVKDGDVYVLNIKDGDSALYKVDLSGQLGEPHEFELNAGFSSSMSQKGAGEYDLFIETDSSLFGYKLSDDSTTKICDYINSDMMVDDTEFIAEIDDKNLICLTMDENENMIAEYYKKVDPKEIENRASITLMCIYANDLIKRTVLEFNKTHTDIRINIISYDDADDPTAKMSADIAAGVIPDIYYTGEGVGDKSIEQCVAKGMFEDLLPYIEKDSELSQDDFLPSVFEAMKTDGKLYYVIPGFSVRTLVANGKFAGDIEGWTFGEMKEYVDSQPENSRLFETENKEEMLMTFLYTSSGDFVDWESGKCSFDSQEFKDVLEMCNSRGKNEMTDYSERGSFTESLRSGEQMFVNQDMSVDDIILFDKLFDGNVAYVGYPNKEREGMYASAYASFAMSSSCENKDAAWQYLRTFLTKDYEGKNYYSGNVLGYPLRKDVFDMYLKTLTATEEYTDEYGTTIMPRNGSAGWGEIEVELKPLSESEVKKISDAVDKVSRMWMYDTSLISIVREEAAAYFAGDKSVEEVTSTIQNRASTYIQENR